MHRLIALGVTLDLVADVASLWTDAGGLGPGDSLLLAAVPAAAALYNFVTPATGEGLFRPETALG